MKIYEPFTCPYCKKTNYTTLRENTEETICSEYEKHIDIEIEYTIKVTAKLPVRKCVICNSLFIADEVELDGQTTCSCCSNTDYHDKV